MKICQKCSLSYPDDKKFCKICGNPLAEESNLNPKEIAQKSVFADKLNANPLDITLLLEYARFLFDKELLNEAITMLLKVLAIDETDLLASELLFQTYRKTGSYNEAFEIGEKLIHLKPNDFTLISGMADISISLGKDDQALKYLDRCLAVNATDKILWIKKATLLSKIKHDKESVVAWHKVFELSPDNILAKMHIGIDYCQTGEFKKAAELLESVVSKIEKDEDKNKAFLFYAYSSIKSKSNLDRLPQLIKNFDFKSFNHSSDPLIKNILEEIFVYQGNYHLQHNEHPEAIENYQNAYQLHKSDQCKQLLADAFFKFGSYKFETDETKSAFENIEKAVELYPNNDDYNSLFKKLSSLKKTGKRKSKFYAMLGIAAFLIICIVIIYAALISPYFTEKSVWEEAKKINTSKSYQVYLNKYHADGRYGDQAYKMIYQLDSLRKIEAENAIQDSMASSIKHAIDIAPEILKGKWHGAFASSTMDLIIENVNTSSDISGYDILKGKKRPVKGTFNVDDNNYYITLNEPGDDKGDGKFVMQLNRTSNLLSGNWQQFNNSSNYSFTFSKNNGSQTNNTGGKLTIKGTKVNIRTAPSMKSGVAMQLNTGDICELLEKGNLENINGINDYWYKISRNGTTGWVFGNFTSIAQLPRR
jgi:tetratricopeptide (TPR) repeat protein